MNTRKIDATHRILEEEIIRKNEIEKKMMREVNRRRNNKLIKELSEDNHNISAMENLLNEMISIRTAGF